MCLDVRIRMSCRRIASRWGEEVGWDVEGRLIDVTATSLETESEKKGE